MDEKGKKVLILTASVGSGHNQAAAAIAEALADQPCRVEKIDIMDYLPAWFRWYYGGGYYFLAARAPWAYGLGYRLFDRPDTPERTFGEKSRIMFEGFAAEKLTDHIEEISPDLIVHTHFLSPPVLGRLDYENQFVVITDILVHRWWYAEKVSRWFVQQPRSAERLVQGWKIPPEKITISGMPVRKSFSVTRSDSPELRDELRLPRDRRIVLLSGGADFTAGPVIKIARELAGIADDVCVVILAGRNKKLLGSLAELEETAAGRVVPMGFTDRVSDLMDTASLIITKPGGMICAECIAKSLPAIFLPPVPGQEANNAKFLEENSAAVTAGRSIDIPELAGELLCDPDRLDAMHKAMGSLYLPGAETIKKGIMEYIG